MQLHTKTTCIDLKLTLHCRLDFVGEPASEQWTHRVFADHGSPSATLLSSLRATVQGQPEGQRLQVSRSVFGHGIFTPHLPPVPMGHSILPESHGIETVPYGVPLQDHFTQHTGNANEQRPWKIYADENAVKTQIRIAVTVYVKEVNIHGNRSLSH